MDIFNWKIAIGKNCEETGHKVSMCPIKCILSFKYAEFINVNESSALARSAIRPGTCSSSENFARCNSVT